MKLFTKKKVIPKMTIVLVFLILFNFITPTYSKADSAGEEAAKVIFVPIRSLLILIGDGTMDLLQYFFVTNEKAVIPVGDQVDAQKEHIGDTGADSAGEHVIEDLGIDNVLLEIEAQTKAYYSDKPNFKFTPQSIFEGAIKFFSIDFINGGNTTSDSSDTNGENAENKDKDKDTFGNSEWYGNLTSYIEELKTELKTEINLNSGTGTVSAKAKAIIRILSGIGVELNGAAGTGDMSKISYSPESLKARFDYLCENYKKGRTIKELCGIATGTEESIAFDELSAEGEIVGFIGTYNRTLGQLNISSTMGPERDYDNEIPVNVMHDIIATWYRILRNIALIGLLCMLVYIGIRIMISSTAADQSKYKAMLTDWVVAICLLFALHYIMAFVTGAINLVISAFSTGAGEAGWTDSIFATVRTNVMDDSLATQVGYTILYLVLVIYTVIFAVQYLKRVVYAAFLTMIAPLVAVTYPIDKIKDGKSQAFDMWLKEYIANAIMQPIHLLIYTTLVSTVMALAAQNVLYAVVAMGAMLPVEKFIREMFGLNNPKTGGAGSFAGGALAASAFNKLLRKPPKFPPRPGENGKGGSGGKIETAEQEKNKIKFSNSDNRKLFDSVAGSTARDNTTLEAYSNANPAGGFDMGSVGNSNASTMAFGSDNLIDNGPTPTYDFSNPSTDNGSGLYDTTSYRNGFDMSGDSSTFSFDSDNMMDDGSHAGDQDWGGLTPEQIEEARSREIDSPDGPQFEQFMQEHGLNTPYNNFDEDSGWGDLTDEQIEDAKSRGIDSPDGPQFEQFLREQGINPETFKNNRRMANRRNAARTNSRGSYSQFTPPLRTSFRTGTSQTNGDYSQFTPPLTVGTGSRPAPYDLREKKQRSYLKQKLRATTKALRKQQVRGNKQTVESLKQLGKGAARFTLKAAGGTVLGAAGAAMGLAGAIASGDPSKLIPMAGAGLAAGVAGGSAFGESTYNVGARLAGGTRDAIVDAHKEFRADMMANNSEYKKRANAQQSRKYARSGNVKAEIRENYGVRDDIKSHIGFFGDQITVFGHQVPGLKNINVGTQAAKQLRKTTREVERLASHGITDTSTAFNCVALEELKDCKGTSLTSAQIKELGANNSDWQEKITLAAQMSQMFNPDDQASWESTRDRMSREFGRRYGDTDKGTEMANKMMRVVAMTKGKTYDEAMTYERQAQTNEQFRQQQLRRDQEIKNSVNNQNGGNNNGGNNSRNNNGGSSSGRNNNGRNTNGRNNT